MRLIRPSHEIWEQDTKGKPIGIITSPETIRAALLRGIYKQIERAGRVCYKSEDKITATSAEEFVGRLIASKHYAMLEHGTVYLKRDYESKKECFESDFFYRYAENPYSEVFREILDSNDKKGSQSLYVTTNFRVIKENGWEEDLEYLTVPQYFHRRRVTVHLICNRQVTHELVRHRKFSFAMESTRYCNYTKGKFGEELTFIQPCWLNEDSILIEDPVYAEAKAKLHWALETIESTYFSLIKANWKPQQAATVLPNALKADIVVTGFVEDWKHLFDLRVKGTTGAPHPQMFEVMAPVYEDFKWRGIVQ